MKLKTKTCALVAILVASILSCMPAAAQAQTPLSSFQSGINYISYGNRYSQDDSVTEADFAYFKANNITAISIRCFWVSLAADDQGNIRTDVIDNFKRVLLIAAKYGLNVQFDFFTHFQDPAWARPAFLTSIYDIIRDPTVKQTYFTFISNTMNALKGYTAIKSWTMMNEPYTVTGHPGDKELFEQCWREQRAVMIAIDNRPVSIRLALGTSPWSGMFSKTVVLEVCDYININEYLDPSKLYDVKYGANWPMFDSAVADSKAAGKPLYVSEFGTFSANTETQRVYFEKSMALFKTKGVNVIFGWCWQSQSPASELYNLAIGPALGQPAFFELAKAGGLTVAPPVVTPPSSTPTPSSAYPSPTAAAAGGNDLLGTIWEMPLVMRVAVFVAIVAVCSILVFKLKKW